MAGLLIAPSTSEDRKQIFTETLLNKTTKINKVSDNAVLSGVAYGVGKVSGKAEKDIILALSKIFPDSAYSSGLDVTAQSFGISPRFNASQSSTYVKVVGDEGTQYIAGTHVFQSVDGLQFTIEETRTLTSAGFDYVKARSVDSGLNTNVKPGTITKISPEPSGHRFCVNEYQAIGGRDLEDDILFRQRIKDGANILAKGTISMIEQVFMLINSNVLRVFYQGLNQQGQLRVAVVTQNGIGLNVSEINDLLLISERFLNLTELRPFGKQSYGLSIENIDIQALDVSFRLELFPSINPDDIRINIQTAIGKYLDFRYFKSGEDNIEWDTLLQIVKSTKGVKYVPDQSFYPHIDIATDPKKVVRVRGFTMLNLDGSVINSTSGSFNPVFYPATADLSFQSTVLQSLAA